MNQSIPKYVTHARASYLLGIPGEELTKLSCECGLGHIEQSGNEIETYYTYEELRKICLAAVNNGGVAHH
jgi:hypothetical protein